MSTPDSGVSSPRPRPPKLPPKSPGSSATQSTPGRPSISSQSSSASTSRPRAPKLPPKAPSSSGTPSQERSSTPTSATRPRPPKLPPKTPSSSSANSSQPAPTSQTKNKNGIIGNEEPSAPSKEESLTTALTGRQRTQLTILLAAATATMRESLAGTFDARATLGPDMAAYADSGDESGGGGGGLTEDEKILNPNIDPGTADVEAHDRERRMLAEREKELSAPRMQELRDELLAWFDGWRETMIGRVGEVVHESADKGKEKIGKEGKEGGEKRREGGVTIGDKKIDPQEAPAGMDGGEKEESVRKEEEEAKKISREMLTELCPPVETPLAELEEEKRVLILHSLLLLLLSLEHYAAPSRVLLLYVVNSLKLPIEALNEDEAKTARGLLEAAKELSGKSEQEKKAVENKQSRKWKVGLATVAGAAIVGVTGGLAAPLVAAGVGSVMGGLGLGATAAAGYLGSVAGSTLVVGGLFGAYGGRMTGQMMDNYAREVEDFAFLPIRPSDSSKHHLLHSARSKEAEEAAGKDDAQNRRLRVTIGISGWLTSKEEVVSPWHVIGHNTEVFALRFELESLMNLGNAITAMVSSAAWGYAKKEIIAHSIFADMMAALWPLGLLQIARVVDNPFSVAKSRADKAGAVLADALQNRAQGERPVTLIGYSLGARVIHATLLALAARKAFGLVDSVVMIGSPIPADAKDWRAMRSVVSGRLVNVYSTNDYVLGFLYRTSSIQLGVAGLQRIEGVMGVENIDVSETVSGHLRYRYLVGSILKKIGFEDIDLKEVRREEEEFQKMLEEEKRKAEEVTKRIPKNLPKHLPGRSKGGKEEDSKKKGEDDDDKSATKENEEPSDVEAAASAEADTLENTVREQTRKSLMQRGIEWWYRPSVSGTAKEGEKAVGSVKSTAESPTSSSYLSYAKSALHLGGGSNVDATKKEAAAAVQAEVPVAGKSGAVDGVKKEGEAAQKQATGKSYLELAANGGRGVGSTAKGWYKGAAEKVGTIRGGQKEEEKEEGVKGGADKAKEKGS